MNSKREAVIVDMETRRLSPHLAAARAAQVAREVRMRGRLPGYFKIDSTLRGNFLREIEAIRRVSSKRLAWVVPANPAMGRWTIGGRQFVNGIPIERTDFARDPLHPVRRGDLLAEAGAQIGKGRCVHLGLADLAAGRGRVASLRRRWIEEGAHMVVADAVRDEDLQRIAECIPGGDLACGAASLARYCAPAGKAGRRTPKFQSPVGRGLGVIGSFNPVTARQVARAGRRRGVEVCRLSPEDLRRPPILPRKGGVRWLVLVLAPRRFRLIKAPSSSDTSKFGGAGDNIARALARYAAQMMDIFKPAQLLLSGGLTAASVCEELGVQELRLIRELAPGLVFSEAYSGKGRFRVVTKPGGFGAADCLARLMR